MPPVRNWLLVTTLLLAGACTSGDDRSDLALRVGNAELGAGAVSAALQTAQGLASAQPDDPHRMVLLGQSYMAAGQLQLAETSLRRALVLDPGSFDAALGLARLHTLTDPSKAFREFHHLAEQHPNDPAVLTDLGVACDLQGRSEEAQSAYRRALSLDPTLISAQVDLGLSFAISGHPDEGLRLLGPIASGPNSSSRIRADYAVAATLDGDPQNAVAALNHDMSPEQARNAMLAFQALGPTIAH